VGQRVDLYRSSNVGFWFFRNRSHIPHASIIY
jgi:hypothetical protein